MSGCAADNPAPASPSGTSILGTPTGVETTTDGNATESPVSGVPLIFFSNCHGSEAFGDLPAGYAPPPVFDEWQSDGTRPVDVGFFAYRCDRIALGSFERGPVHFLLEYHSSGAPPAACWGEEATWLFTLAAFWIDDADIAAALHDWHGLPVQVATILREEAPFEGIGPVRWSFSAGGPTSYFEVPIAEINMVSTDDSERFVWAFNGTVSAFDLHRAYEKGQTNVLVTEGEMAEPTAWNRYASDIPFAGRGDVMRTVELEGHFSSYKDKMCQEPE